MESADLREPLCGSTLNMSSPSHTDPSYRFDDSRFYLLVVVGEIASEEHLRCAIADIEKGRGERAAGEKGNRGFCSDAGQLDTELPSGA